MGRSGKASWAKAVLYVWVLAALLAGCVSFGRGEPPPPLPEASPTPEPLPATETPRPEPTRTLIRLATPTPAVAPTEQETETPSPVPTLLPTPDIAATLSAGPPSRELGPYPSPDNLLEAIIHVHDCAPLEDGAEYAYEELAFRQTNTTVEQDAANQLILCDALGAFGLEGLYWSQNGRYFYYTNAREGAPDGCGYWRPPVIRYDIVSGLNVPLGAGPLAPDELKLATWQNDQLMIWSLSNTTPTSVFDPAVPGELLGPIAWSRDSEFVAYLQSPTWCPAGPTSVVLVSLQTGQQQVVVSAHAPGFSNIEWTTSRTLTVYSESGDAWTYDVERAELSGPNN